LACLWGLKKILIPPRAINHLFLHIVPFKFSPHLTPISYLSPPLSSIISSLFNSFFGIYYGIGPGQCGVSHERIRVPLLKDKRRNLRIKERKKKVDIEDNGRNACIYYVIIE